MREGDDGSDGGRGPSHGEEIVVEQRLVGGEDCRALAASSTPRSRSSSGIVSAGVAVQDRRHPDRLGAGAVLAQVVDEDGVARLDAEPLAGEQVDLGLRLVEADVAGDHRRVEEVAGRQPVVDPEPPRVRDQAGRDAGGAGRLDAATMRSSDSSPANMRAIRPS